MIRAILRSAESQGSVAGGRVARGVVWSLSGTLAVQVGTFLNTIVLARILGLEVFGKLGVISAFVAMVAGIAGLGLATTATRYVSYFGTKNPQRAANTLVLCRRVVTISGAACGACVTLAASGLSDSIFRIPDIVPEMRLGGIWIFLFTLNTFQAGVLTGIEAFKKLANAMVIQATTGLTLSVGLSAFLGLRGAVFAAIGSLAVSSFAQARFLRSEFTRGDLQTRGFEIWAERRILLDFALPAALSGVVGCVAIGVGSVLLARESDGARQVGIFNAAAGVRSLLLYLPGLMSRVTLPVLSSLHGLGESVEVLKTVRGALALNIALVSGGALCVFFAADPIWSLFGKGFQPPVLMMVLLLTSGVLEAVAVSLFQVLYAHGRMWLHLGILVGWSVILAIVAWAFVGRSGPTGLAFAYCVAWCASTILYACATWRILLTGDDRAFGGN
jgi:O-antigen/teichoic acid export membrane protein